MNVAYITSSFVSFLLKVEESVSCDVFCVNTESLTLQTYRRKYRVCFENKDSLAYIFFKYSEITASLLSLLR